MNKRIEKKAYAKINLCLDVTGRRSDGYHTVNMIMQQIELHDDVIIEAIDAKRSEKISLNLKDIRNEIKGYSTKEKNVIPEGGDNLMYRAAELMKRSYGISEGIAMSLTKRIPSQAGLGGGSADAAAVFRGINELFELGASDEELMKLSAGLGSDIPFCIIGGTARAEGTGTDITVLRPLAEHSGSIEAFPQHLLLIKPDMGGSTPKIYAAYDSAEQRLSDKIRHPDTEKLTHAVERLQGAELRQIFSENNINMLEYAVRPIEAFNEKEENTYACTNDIIGFLKEKLMENGAFAASMTGSGSVVYGLFDKREQLERAADVMGKLSAENGMISIIETRLFDASVLEK